MSSWVKVNFGEPAARLIPRNLPPESSAEDNESIAGIAYRKHDAVALRTRG